MSALAGQQIGKSAAEFVFANFITPRSRWDDCGSCG
jgi:hypothetical protein